MFHFEVYWECVRKWPFSLYWRLVLSFVLNRILFFRQFNSSIMTPVLHWVCSLYEGKITVYRTSWQSKHSPSQVAAPVGYLSSAAHTEHTLSELHLEQDGSPQTKNIKASLYLKIYPFKHYFIVCVWKNWNWERF